MSRMICVLLILVLAPFALGQPQPGTIAFHYTADSYITQGTTPSIGYLSDTDPLYSFQNLTYDSGSSSWISSLPIDASQLTISTGWGTFISIPSSALSSLFDATTATITYDLYYDDDFGSVVQSWQVVRHDGSSPGSSSGGPSYLQVEQDGSFGTPQHGINFPSPPGSGLPGIFSAGVDVDGLSISAALKLAYWLGTIIALAFAFMIAWVGFMFYRHLTLNRQSM